MSLYLTITGTRTSALRTWLRAQRAAEFAVERAAYVAILEFPEPVGFDGQPYNEGTCSNMLPEDWRPLPLAFDDLRRKIRQSFELPMQPPAVFASKWLLGRPHCTVCHKDCSACVCAEKRDQGKD